MGRKERQIQQRRGLEQKSSAQQFIPVAIAFALLIVAVVLVGLAVDRILDSTKPPATTVPELVEI